MGLYGMDRITAKPVASVLKSGYLPFFNLGGVVTDIEESNVKIPTKFSLEQNYPNPFNPETKIVFSLPYAGNVKLKIFDVLGNEVSTLLNEFRAAGRYEVDFNIDIISNNISSGVYFYRIEADNFVSTKKMIYLK
jgi:hypothetical protein